MSQLPGHPRPVRLCYPASVSAPLFHISEAKSAPTAAGGSAIECCRRTSRDRATLPRAVAVGQHIFGDQRERRNQRSRTRATPARGASRRLQCEGDRLANAIAAKSHITGFPGTLRHRPGPGSADRPRRPCRKSPLRARGSDVARACVTPIEAGHDAGPKNLVVLPLHAPAMSTLRGYSSPRPKPTENLPRTLCRELQHARRGALADHDAARAVFGCHAALIWSQAVQGPRNNPARNIAAAAMTFIFIRGLPSSSPAGARCGVLVGPLKPVAPRNHGSLQSALALYVDSRTTVREILQHRHATIHQICAIGIAQEKSACWYARERDAPPLCASRIAFSLPYARNSRVRHAACSSAKALALRSTLAACLGDFIALVAGSTSRTRTCGLSSFSYPIRQFAVRKSNCCAIAAPVVTPISAKHKATRHGCFMPCSAPGLMARRYPAHSRARPARRNAQTQSAPATNMATQDTQSGTTQSATWAEPIHQEHWPHDMTPAVPKTAPVGLNVRAHSVWFLSKKIARPT
mgnify:CR=1 FL=1